MKKFGILALTLILSFSLTACGKRDNKETTPSTTAPTTGSTIIPGMDPTILDPTIDTNIPDPNVDTSMPDFTEGTNSTNSTSDTDGTARGMH